MKFALPEIIHRVLRITTLLLFAASAAATAQSVTQLRGQITEFEFRSPASSIGLLVADASGVTSWEIKAPSATQLRRLGWNGSSLFTGEQVQVFVRTIPGAPNQAELVSLTRANGALLVASAQQDTGALNLAAIPSGTYQLDKNHAYIVFSYDHSGFSTPRLRFDRFDASLNYNSANPTSSEVSVEVDVSSVNSGVAALDQELRGADFFDSLNHPRVSFRATRLELNAWGNMKVSGELDIKGQKHPLALTGRVNGVGLNPASNNYTLGLSLSGSIKRSEVGMGKFAEIAGDEVQIQIEAEFIRSAANR